jgi:D-alanyl-D-alanine carboxypeptidase (penicillin-binding protein 5/6)
MPGPIEDIRQMFNRFVPSTIGAIAFIVMAFPAAAFETQATSAYIYDMTTRTVLYEKNADEPLPPASMSKLMTVYMLFEALRENPNVTMDTRFGVSTKAREMGGSTMFLNERDRPTVEELIQGIVVQSGNDATVVVAEGLAGSEEAFSQKMNERAKTLGLTNSTFANASGWPDPNHRMSMRDLGLIAEHIIREFPEYYGYFKEAEYDFDGRAPQNRFNRNPLLKLNIGADGLKTGHTEESGFGLVGSAVQNDRRIIFVLNGMTSMAMRAQESESVVNWAFRQFISTKVASEGEHIAEADVWMGEIQKVGLVAPSDLNVLSEAVSTTPMTTEIVYNGPLEAPITAGDQIAELVVRRGGLPDAHLPLVAERDVARGGFVPRLRSASIVLGNRIMTAVKDQL